MIFVLPTNIVPVGLFGDGNMGDVTDPASDARFGLDSVPPGGSYIPTMLKIRAFNGTGSALLLLKVDHRKGSKFDFTLRRWKNFGVGTAAKYTNIFLRISEDPELRDWQMWRDPNSLILDRLVLEWANPDPGNMEWAAEFGLVDSVNVMG